MLNMKGSLVLWFWCVFFCCETSDGNNAILEDISARMRQRFDELDTFLHVSVVENFADLNYEMEAMNQRLDGIHDSQKVMEKKVEDSQMVMEKKILESNSEMIQLREVITSMKEESNSELIQLREVITSMKEESNSEMIQLREVITSMKEEPNSEMIQMRDIITSMKEESNSEMIQLRDVITSMKEESNSEMIQLRDVITSMKEGQVAEQQQSSNSDDMLQVFSEILKYERDLQTEFWNTSCHVNDIEELQRNFSTELKQGQNLIQGSLNEVQQNVGELQLGQQGIQESQMAVQGKVEALRDGQGILQGSLNEVQQNVGELKQGQNLIQGLICDPPARVVLPFGCVFPVKEKKTWSEAQENCERLGKTLLEGISSQRELDELNTHFRTFLFGSYGRVWVGMQKLRWMEGGDPAPPSSSSLWESGYPRPPGSGNDCGAAFFYMDGTSSLADLPCSFSRSSLCQEKKN